MNLNEIEAKCFIMALFIRDDGLRFLLGSGAYEFKDSQLMFAGNTIENDVVSVQGNDGYMLAGQVRRPNTQVFDGYIGDASVSKSEVEGYRRDFMAFFQKNHFYTVVYVMADGSAIQRRRGFLVDAPTSQELWQMYPEYHVALNFEDVNYYKYSENDDGEETYGKSADIGLAKVQYGGLIWDNNSEIEISGTGTNITLAGTMEGGAIESVGLNGDTEQQTYSGKNLANIRGDIIKSGAATVSVSGESITVTTSGGGAWCFVPLERVKISQQQTKISYQVEGNYQNVGVLFYYNTTHMGNITWLFNGAIFHSGDTVTFPNLSNYADVGVVVYANNANVSATGTTMTYKNIQLELGTSVTSYEPYVGGTASPNPDYPQEVQTVTGRQVVTISDGGSQSQEYEVNLGKNLLPFTNQNFTLKGVTFTVTNGTLYLDGTSEGETYANNQMFKDNFSFTLQPGTYILSRNTSHLVTVQIKKFSDGTNLASINGTYTTDIFTLTEPTKVVFGFYMYQNTFDNVNLELMLEKGSVATTYAPYFTPIELCKIGTYQDYIYKSGEDWYVHKEIGKVTFTGAETETWSSATAATGYVRFSTASGETHADNNGYCNELINRGSQSHGAYEYVWVQPNANAFYIQILNTRANDLSSFRTWLGANPATVYYDISTPTDTQITNATLISELEDLLSATTYSGTTYITVSGDLASPLEIKVITIGGGGVVWDENGAEWEAGGGGEIVIVNVDSIENILPVWTIRGEAENPTLTNLTTGMSITYNGTVASGQTLVIDLLNKTAKLNGTSVISDVSGQWVEFKPGNNRVSYSTENANAPDSTIEWQEVVG